MFGRKIAHGRKLARAGKKPATKSARTAKRAAPGGLIGILTDPKIAKRALSVAKIAGPALVPYAMKAATRIRGFLDDRRALKLGVTADQVAAYRGPTGPAGARIAGLRSSIADLRRRRTSDLQVARFAEVASARLVDLQTAVQTSAAMPTQRRRGTLTAVSKELNRIEADLVAYLVGSQG